MRSPSPFKAMCPRYEGKPKGQLSLSSTWGCQALVVRMRSAAKQLLELVLVVPCVAQDFFG
jgi:hypothetical protein